MKHKKRPLLALLFLIPMTLLAQKPEIKSGEVSPLLGVEKINVKFDFSKWTFYNERMTEKEYVAKRIKDITADKGAEEAKKWHKDWLKTKNEDIPNLFISSLNDAIRNEIIFGQNMDEAQYTLTINMEWCYPGYFAAAVNQPAKLTANFVFTKNDNPSTSILVLREENLRGVVKGFSILSVAPNTNNRIATVFTTAGNYIGHFLRKQLKKAKKAAKK